MRTFTLICLAAALFLLFGCKGMRQQTDAQRPLIADGQPAISVQLDLTGRRIISPQTGVDMIPGVDIYADGLCTIRRFDGTEAQRRISQCQIAALVRFFETERVLGLTDAAIEQAISSDIRHQLEQSNSVSMVGSTHQIRTQLVIRQPTLLTQVSRYGLSDEIKSHPSAWELVAVERCVGKIYETLCE